MYALIAAITKTAKLSQPTNFIYMSRRSILHGIGLSSFRAPACALAFGYSFEHIGYRVLAAYAFILILRMHVLVDR